MPAGFPGFSDEFVKFFKGLERNNNREWFQQRKDTFETAVKAPFLELVESINRQLFRFAPQYITDPKRSMYRIYRDTRFSNDKTPYKLHAAGLFTRRGLEKNHGAGLYFSVSHKEVEIAGGVYMPLPEDLRELREYVGEHHQEFRKLIANKKLVGAVGPMQGEQLSRVPKGFPADHPAADLLRYKQFLFYTLLPPDLVTTPRLEVEIVDRLKLLTPFVEFLNAARKPKGRDVHYLG